MTAPNGPILFNSSSGSDTAASGLGPSTAVSGTGASTSAASATVDLSADTPDLSGVSAGDLLWVDSSSGRQFSIIASVDDGADTVTCDDTFDNTESSRNWGIGGKRASLDGSARIITEDCYYGWTVQLQDGYVETGLTEFDLLNTVGGSSSDGPFTIEGDPNYTTKPILEWDTTGRALDIRRGDYLHLKHFTARNANGSPGHFTTTGGNGVYFFDLTVADASKPFASFNAAANLLGGFTIEACEIGHCTGSGVGLFGNMGNVIGCHIHNCGSHGVAISGGSGEGIIYDNVIADNGGDGIHDNRSTNTQKGGIRIIGNAVDNNASDGYEFTDASVANTGSLVLNNLFTNNGGYGINGAGTALQNDGYNFRADYNAYYSNTSGQRNNVNAGDNDVTLTADPYTDAANDEFTLNSTAGGGADCVDAGFPQTIPGT